MNASYQIESNRIKWYTWCLSDLCVSDVGKKSAASLFQSHACIDGMRDEVYGFCAPHPVGGGSRAWREGPLGTAAVRSRHPY